MERIIAKRAILGCTKKIMDDTKELITSVDSVDEQLKEIEKMTKGMNPVDMLLNLENIAESMAKNTTKKASPQERAVIGSLMECHSKLTLIYITEEIPTVREIAKIMSELHLALRGFEGLFRDKEGMKMPSKELFEAMFSLVNARIIAQK